MILDGAIVDTCPGCNRAPNTIKHNNEGKMLIPILQSISEFITTYNKVLSVSVEAKARGFIRRWKSESARGVGGISLDS